MTSNRNKVDELVDLALAVLNKYRPYDQSTFSSPVSAAADILGQALHLDPLCRPALIELGRCYRYSPTRCADAVSLFQRAIEIDTDDPVPYYEIGLTYLHAGDSGISLFNKESHRESLNYFAKADELGYQSKSWLYNHIGTAHFRMKNYKEARMWFERSFESLMRERAWIPSTFYLAAKVSEHVGDAASAVMWYERCKSEGRAGGLDETIDDRIEVLRRISNKPRILQRFWLRIYRYGFPRW